MSIFYVIEKISGLCKKICRILGRKKIHDFDKKYMQNSLFACVFPKNPAARAIIIDDIIMKNQSALRLGEPKKKKPALRLGEPKKINLHCGSASKKTVCAAARRAALRLGNFCLRVSETKK